MECNKSKCVIGRKVPAIIRLAKKCRKRVSHVGTGHSLVWHMLELIKPFLFYFRIILAYVASKNETHGRLIWTRVTCPSPFYYGLFICQSKTFITLILIPANNINKFCLNICPTWNWDTCLSWINSKNMIESTFKYRFRRSYLYWKRISVDLPKTISLWTSRCLSHAKMGHLTASIEVELQAWRHHNVNSC